MVKRILQVVTIMDRGGLESRLMDIYRAMDPDKIQFDFLTHRQERGMYDDEIEALGGKIYSLFPIAPKVVLSGKYQRELDKFFIEHTGYEVVHVHLTELSSFALYAAKKAGIPTRIAHSRSAGAVPGLPLKRIFKRLSSFFVWPNCTHAFAVSQEAGKWLYGNNAFKVIPNAIKASAFCFNSEVRKDIRDKLDLNGRFVIGHVGSFGAGKNHEFLIDVFFAIHCKRQDSVLMLVGDADTPRGDCIRNKVESLGLSQSVRFTGVQTDVAPFYQTMDVFVMPSLFEGLPGAGLEAQAAGLPCVFSDPITRDVNIIPDLVEYLPLNNNAEKWADAIIERSGIPRWDTYQNMADAGFDIAAVANWYEEFYLNN